MKRVAAGFAVLLVVGVSTAQAQEKAAGTASTSGITGIFHMAHANIVKAAEQVPEDKYSFQPTKEVRTMGALFAHIADANNFFCSQVTGAPKDYSDKVEKTAKTKAEIVAALKASYDVCGAAYGAVTDAQLSKPISIFGMNLNWAGALAMNASHNWEHYGNVVTYMRINGMVPPSSQQ
jgi:uncharacterized damage-inducible protein DinB